MKKIDMLFVNVYSVNLLSKTNRSIAFNNLFIHRVVQRKFKRIRYIFHSTIYFVFSNDCESMGNKAFTSPRRLKYLNSIRTIELNKRYAH